MRLPLQVRVRGRLLRSKLIPGWVRQRSARLSGFSREYRLVGYSDDARSQISNRDGWQQVPVVARQHAAWEHLLESLAAGDTPRVDVDNLRVAAFRVVSPHDVVLEIGCGSGYNARLLTSFEPSVRYIGLDSSSAAITFARRVDDAMRLVAANALRLPMRDRSVSVVLDGGALIHIPKWEDVLREQCRVASHAVILHSVTVTDASTTAYLTKRAYGYVVPEVVIARSDLQAALDECGFVVDCVLPGITYDLEPAIEIPTVSETWVCRRG